jgi:hypothetical protein
MTPSFEQGLIRTPSGAHSLPVRVARNGSASFPTAASPAGSAGRPAGKHWSGGGRSRRWTTGLRLAEEEDAPEGDWPADDSPASRRLRNRIDASMRALEQGK